ncbi:MAG: TetR/AcrR family transcriptional regulator [Actinomycetota bacterium]|nr:TetR/AcrR family transcriptional regulator [Actinomycetota bacterium]
MTVTPSKNQSATANKNGPGSAGKNGPLTAPKNGPGTAERILDIAERLVQVRGFNNFSYADIATELGITKASLHYHFPGKAELGQALIDRYAERFSEALTKIDEDLPDAPAKLEAYAGLYAEVLRGKRMCMCGILAAEYQTLPAPMRSAVIEFFDENQEWLARVLAAGRAERTLTFKGSPEEIAQAILSTLEGAMLVARPYGDMARFTSTAQQLLAGLTR